MKAISLRNEFCSGLVLLRRFEESPRFQFLDLVNLVSAKQSNSQHKESSTNGNQAKSWPAVAAAPHLGPSPTQGGPQRTRTAAEDAARPSHPWATWLAPGPAGLGRWSFGRATAAPDSSASRGRYAFYK